MFAFLNGTLSAALPTRIVVEVHGVGYQLEIPLSSYDRLPEPGKEIKVLTRLIVREDAHTLFGFMSEAERDLFDLLVSHVSGVGPKVALSVLSGLPVELFKAAVVAGDVDRLSKVKGLGRKTAERIVVELKDRIGVAAAWEASSAIAAGGLESQANDAVLALISLGYKQVDAHKAVRAAAMDDADMDSEQLVRAALRRLAA